MCHTNLTAKQLNSTENSIFTSLGDRMKEYEESLHVRIAVPFVIIRLNGRGFSQFTRSFQQPYDERIHLAMTETCKDVLTNYHDCTIAYTQSDEITLIFTNGLQQFNGRTDKYLSLLGSLVSVRFNHHLKFQPEISDSNLGIATFDARIFIVPTIEECLYCILWRRTDNHRNSVDKYARQHFSAKELNKKNTSDKIEMMKTSGVDYYQVAPTWVQNGHTEFNSMLSVLKDLRDYRQTRTFRAYW